MKIHELKSREYRIDRHTVHSCQVLMKKDVYGELYTEQFYATVLTFFYFFAIHHAYMMLHFNFTFVFSSRCMLEQKFAIYHRAASLPSQASSVDVCSIG